MPELNREAIRLSHSAVTEPGSSQRFFGFIEKPVLNISGRKTMSVPSGISEISRSSLMKF
jgi:hypothetical protein